MAGNYERELKGILHGEKEHIGKFIKTCTPEEKDNYMSVLEQPFIVIRAAGSLGVDLVAVRYDVAFPIEVKASQSKVLHFTKRKMLSEQAEELREECRRAHLIPIYAFRLKRQRGDAWRIFTMDMDIEKGQRLKILHRRLPKIERTAQGNEVMRWDNGMPLNEFLAYLCRE